MKPTLFVILPAFFFHLNRIDSFPSGKIVNGQNATKGQFPFHVVLAKRVSKTEYKPFCGGSLIHPSFVLTAAHCVQGNIKSFAVIGGIISVNDPKKVVRMTGKVVPHEDYEGHQRDIAIIKLERPMKCRTTRPIKLPDPKLVFGKESNPIAVGFGRTSGDSPMDMNSVLAYTKMMITDDEHCSSKGPGFDSDSHICTRYASTHSGTCYGDSGGALTDSSGNIILGLLNYGDRGCIADFDVFAKVSAYIPWIQDQMKSLS